MHIRQSIKKADRLINSLSGRDCTALQGICTQIQTAQNNLVQQAHAYFEICLQQCQGLCCRNIYVDSIVTLLDYIFILSLDSGIKAEILKAAKNQSLFSADCIFLRDQVGPCLFAPTIKPERCIITFCSDCRPLNSEIKAIREAFSRLYRFMVLRRPVMWFGF